MRLPAPEQRPTSPAGTAAERHAADGAAADAAELADAPVDEPEAAGTAGRRHEAAGRTDRA
jgi:hypothetical protein